MTAFQKILTAKEIKLMQQKSAYFIFLFSAAVSLAVLSGCSGCSVSSKWLSEKGHVYNNSFSETGGMQGNLFWNNPYNENIGGLIIDQSSTLYYIRGNKVQALEHANTLTPNIKWTYPVNGNTVGSLSMDDDGNVFFGCDDNKLYQVREEELLWQFPLPTGTITTAPLVFDGYVYVGSSDGRLYSLNYSLKKINWILKANGPILSLTMLPGSMIYAVSGDNNIYAIDIQSTDIPVIPGIPITPKWVKPLKGKATDVPPCFPNDFKRLFIPSDIDGKVHIQGLNPATGAPTDWDYDIPSNECALFCLQYMCANTDRLFLLGGFGIKAISTTSPSEEWESKAGSNFFCQPVIDSKNLYFATDHDIFAVNEKNNEPIWHQPTSHENRNNSMIIGDKILYVGLVNPFGTSPDKNTLFAFK